MENSARIGSLVVLGFQNFAYGMLLPISRRPDQYGEVSFGPTAVLTTEALKIVISLCALTVEALRKIRERHYEFLSQDTEGSSTYTKPEYSDDYSSASLPNSLKLDSNTLLSSDRYFDYTAFWSDTFLDRNNMKLLLPAVLFVIQNNLQVLAASYLGKLKKIYNIDFSRSRSLIPFDHNDSDATEFQVLSQLKIVAAAVCSTLFLHKRLYKQHWASIGLLLMGIALVQQSANENAEVSSLFGKQVLHGFVFGFVAMLGACCFSGIASVTTEYLLKNETGFWISNLLLALYSLIPASFPVIADCARHTSFHPYRAFNLAAWLSILLNAVGGILVSIVIKYADNILKGFAVSGSVVATVLVNSFTSKKGISPARLLGSLLVAVSMYIYGQASRNRADRQVKFEVEEEIQAEGHLLK